MKNYRKYLISFGVALVIAVLFTQHEIASLPSGRKSVLQAYADGTFFSGVFFFSFGILSSLSTTGLFDSTNYAFKRLFNTFFHPKKKDPNFKSYYDWVRAKEKREKDSLTFLVVIGVIFLFISALFLFFFYR